MATRVERLRPTRRRLLSWLAALPPALAMKSVASAGAPQPVVLVIYSSSRLLPANVDGDRGLRQTIRSTADRPVLVLDEYLDMPRVGGKAYEGTLLNYLKDKYGAQQPSLVIAAGDLALGFLLEHRQQLFANVPLLHMSLSVTALARRSPLPPDVVGIPIDYDFERTIEQALRWHPKARQLVLVTGASALDRGFELRLRAAAPRFADKVRVEFLTALPLDVVLQRLRELPKDAVLFTPGFFADGKGLAFTPREAAEAMAKASIAPVYGPFHTFLGTGVVGGFVTPFEDIGRRTGEIANQLLDGASPASLHLPPVMPTTLHADWRQLRRWRIDDDAVPHDAVVMFRWPILVRQLWFVLLAALVIAAGLPLLLWRWWRRRRRAGAQSRVV